MPRNIDENDDRTELSRRDVGKAVVGALAGAGFASGRGSALNDVRGVGTVQGGIVSSPITQFGEGGGFSFSTSGGDSFQIRARVNNNNQFSLVANTSPGATPTQTQTTGITTGTQTKQVTVSATGSCNTVTVGGHINYASANPMSIIRNPAGTDPTVVASRQRIYSTSLLQYQNTNVASPSYAVRAHATGLTQSTAVVTASLRCNVKEQTSNIADVASTSTVSGNASGLYTVQNQSVTKIKVQLATGTGGFAYSVPGDVRPYVRVNTRTLIETNNLPQTATTTFNTPSNSPQIFFGGHASSVATGSAAVTANTTATIQITGVTQTSIKTLQFTPTKSVSAVRVHIGATGGPVIPSFTGQVAYAGNAATAQIPTNGTTTQTETGNVLNLSAGSPATLRAKVQATPTQTINGTYTLRATAEALVGQSVASLQLNGTDYLA